MSVVLLKSTPELATVTTMRSLLKEDILHKVVFFFLTTCTDRQKKYRTS